MSIEWLIIIILILTVIYQNARINELSKTASRRRPARQPRRAYRGWR